MTTRFNRPFKDEIKKVYGSGWTESEGERRAKLDNMLGHILAEQTANKILVYHYTDTKSAALIAKNGFRTDPKGDGMQGPGIYFSDMSPPNHGWPSVSFKKEALTENYGKTRVNNETRADNSALEQKVQACIVCAVNKSLLMEVDKRDSAWVLPLSYIEQFAVKKDDGKLYSGSGTIVRIYELFGDSAECGLADDDFAEFFDAIRMNQIEKQGEARRIAQRMGAGSFADLVENDCLTEFIDQLNLVEIPRKRALRFKANISSTASTQSVSRIRMSPQQLFPRQEQDYGQDYNRQGGSESDTSSGCESPPHRSQGRNKQLDLTGIEGMKLVELRAFAKANGLKVRLDVGGVGRRTKEDIISDIRRVAAQFC